MGLVTRNRTEIGRCTNCDRNEVVPGYEWQRSGGAKCSQCGYRLESLKKPKQNKWDRNPLWFMNKPEPGQTEQQPKPVKPESQSVSVKLTEKMIRAGYDDRGGIDNKQVELLGTTMKAGWIMRLVGRTVPRWKYEKFLAMRRVCEPKLTKQERKSKRPTGPWADLMGYQKPKPHWLVRFDGSCEGNGTPDATGRWAFTIQDETYHMVAQASGETDADVVTNNQSEWQGLRNALEKLVALKRVGSEVPGLLIEGDSKLVILCLIDQWNSKKESLKVHRDACRQLISELGVPWFASWIPRAENEYCDELAGCSKRELAG